MRGRGRMEGRQGMGGFREAVSSVIPSPGPSLAPAPHVGLTLTVVRDTLSLPAELAQPGDRALSLHPKETSHGGGMGTWTGG